MSVCDEVRQVTDESRAIFFSQRKAAAKVTQSREDTDEAEDILFLKGQ